MFRSRRVTPTSVLRYTLNRWLITACHAEAREVRMIKCQSSFVYASSIWFNTTTKVIKYNHLTSSFPSKNKVWLWVSPVLQHRFTLTTCKAHPKQTHHRFGHWWNTCYLLESLLSVWYIQISTPRQTGASLLLILSVGNRTVSVDRRMCGLYNQKTAAHYDLRHQG